MVSAKTAGKNLEREIEVDLLELTHQTLQDDINTRTHRIRNSGGDMSDKGDVLTNIPALKKQLLIECKRRGSYSKKEGYFLNVLYEWMPKINEEADRRGCEPVFLGSFTGVKSFRKFIIMPKRTLDSLGFTIPNTIEKLKPETFKNKNSYFRIKRDAVVNMTIKELVLEDLTDIYIFDYNFFINIIKCIVENSKL